MDKLEVYVKIKISKPKPSEINKLQNDLNNIPKIIPCKNNATLLFIHRETYCKNTKIYTRMKTLSSL